MMHITVNGFRLAGQRTGVGRYIQALLREWGNWLGKEQVRVLVPAPLSDEEACRIPFEVRVVGRGWPALAWENLFLPRRLPANAVLFCPSYTMPLGFRGKGVVSNLGIYEAMPEQFPWWHRYRYGRLFAHSARRATLVIANSQSTRSDIARHYGVPAERIRVVLPGVDGVFRPREVGEEMRPLRQRLGLGPAPYLLYVGKLSHRRHVPELLSAFDLLKRREHFPHHLVVVGPNPLGWDIGGAMAALDSRADVHYVPHLDWESLACLYAGAALFVLPTEHEGFSFTILEAMASGAPVVTLDHAALEGGLRQAVVLAPSPSVADLAATILPCLQDAELARKLRQQSLAAAERFSWRATARQTLDLLRQVAEAA
jgi:glycosyltransferase involved in cell wall biosynthesis